jgi:hypothetical protein
MKIRLTAILLCTAASGFAHRLDEYLQGALISLEKNRFEAEITLTPGVAVFPIVLAAIDTDSDGVISKAERRAYAGQVLRDVSLTIDGYALKPRLLSMRFPPIEEMKEGLGEIRIAFDGDLPPGDTNRKLIFENHHLSRIAAYQVNCLVPRDSDIRIVAQNRNYSQSHYELDFVHAAVASGPPLLAWWSGSGSLLGPIALVLLARLALLLRQRSSAPGFR